jgi:hypothetical protein
VRGTCRGLSRSDDDNDNHRQPLFVKPFHVSRFADGLRSCDWTHATADFLQILDLDRQPAQWKTVKEKNLNKAHAYTTLDTRPTRLIAPSSLLCHRRKPTRSLQICNQSRHPSSRRAFSAIVHTFTHKDKPLTDACA